MYDLTSSATIRRFCQKYYVHPKHKRGQNFLVDKNVLNKIVEAANLKKDDVVLEIGPGFGTLTRELAERVEKVVAVEADRRLAAAFRAIWSSEASRASFAPTLASFYKNVEIVEADILKLPITNYQLPNYKYKIVANLPYQITSAVFRKFLENEPRPESMTVMAQKEVAERICALPGQMSLLSVSVQFFGIPEIVEIVPRAAFWPEPEVDSAILKISRIKNVAENNLNKILKRESLNELETDEKQIALQKFFSVVKIGFSARRKQLQNNLAGGLRLPNATVQKILIDLGFDPKIRAQDLSVEDWIRLVQTLNYSIA